jgi:hypothetical protein
MDIKFHLRITGPKEYLPEGIKYEEHTITQEDIEDTREEGETDDDVIHYIIGEEISAWEQHWCNATLITKEEYEKLNK